MGWKYVYIYICIYIYIYGIYPLVIKPGNGKSFICRCFFSSKDICLIYGFSSQPHLITGGYTYEQVPYPILYYSTAPQQKKIEFSNVLGTWRWLTVLFLFACTNMCGPEFLFWEHYIFTYIYSG